MTGIISFQKSIHKKISDNLYNHYNVNPRELYSAKKYTDGYGAAGYALVYKTQDTPYDSIKLVDTDLNGNIKTFIETI